MGTVSPSYRDEENEDNDDDEDEGSLSIGGEQRSHFDDFGRKCALI